VVLGCGWKDSGAVIVFVDVKTKYWYLREYDLDRILLMSFGKSNSSLEATPLFF
jgi:hypothetical protein